MIEDKIVDEGGKLKKKQRKKDKRDERRKREKRDELIDRQKDRYIVSKRIYIYNWMKGKHKRNTNITESKIRGILN